MSREQAVSSYPPGGIVLAVLLAASSLTVMAGATIAPSLPGLAQHFSDIPDAEFLARLALTLPALLIAISSPIMGMLVDRYGPRNVLFWSTIIYIAGGSSGAYVPDLFTLLGGRALLGIGVAGVMTSTTTLIGSLYPPQTRDSVLGYQGAAMALGGVMFLTAGGWLAEVSWRLPFYIYALPILLLPLILAKLPKPATGVQSGQEGVPDTAMPWARLAMLYTFALVAMALFYIVPTQIPFRLVAAGFENASLSGYAIAISTFASATTALYFSRIKAALPAAGALGLTFAGLGFGLLIAGVSDSFLVIACAMLLAGAGAGLTMPVMSSLVLETTPASGRGRATGGLSMSVFLGQFISPILLTALSPSETISGSFVWAGGFALVSATGFFLVLTARRLSSPRLATDEET